MMNMITRDQKMLELIHLAKTVATSRATVLIQGESGTGKELMASLIHRSSSRSAQPFVAINCAAIPESLLESELFGYEKGAFTGAITSKPGKFELAHGGTLLLDEISEIDIRLQAKLLRVLQEGEVDRIGGRKPVPVDVRIIATTNRNLHECVRNGSFREDLYYRLNVVNFIMPSLRDRQCDIQPLAEHFIKFYANKNSRPVPRLNQEALSLLQMHNWPGNVRELENVIERAVITVNGDEILPSDLSIYRRETRDEDHLNRRVVNPTTLSKGNSSSKLAETTSQNTNALSNFSWSPGSTLEEIERRVILEALEFHKGNRTHTAKALGISIRTLRNKIADFKAMGIHV
jgi:two-component system response regulator FlrC